jgi:Domain of unknown function (DUF2382)
MPDLQEFEVRLSDGSKGTVLRTSRFLDKREFNTVKLSNGTELTVPSSALEPQQDGSFLLRDGQTHSPEQREDHSIRSGTDVTTQTDVTPQTDVTAQDEPNVDASLFKEEVDVQRVPVNRILDAPAETRVEGDVTIIPVMEERLKVEKQLILREEIRIVKKRTSAPGPRFISAEKDRGNASSDREPDR